MIITLGGVPGSGKSTVANKLARALGYKHYSSGGIMRDMARRRGITLLELSRLAESDPEIDKEIDKASMELAKEEDNFVIDSHMGFHFIPRSVKVFLDADLSECARRIFSDLRPEEKENATLEKTLVGVKRRIESERERYVKYYGVDHYDKANYDLVIDTTRLSVRKVVEKILEFIKKTKK